LPSSEKSSYCFFGENVHHRRSSSIENGNGSFFKVSQTPPRCDFTGMAIDSTSFVGEAVPQEKTGCNDQANDDEKIKSIRPFHG